MAADVAARRALRALVLPIIWVVACSAHAADAADLQPQTVAAFNRYVAATEARMEPEVRGDGRFLWTATLQPSERDARLDALRRGALAIERLVTRENGRPIAVPDGLVHHWVGLAFLPGVPIDRAVSLLQDYDRHAAVYAPRIARSAVRTRNGDAISFHLRFFMKKVLTVVIDSENDARFTRAAADRAYSRIVSTRMTEVENPGTPREANRPEGRDGGFLWRLNTYWRFLERDGGTYLQCESVSLTRDVPVGLGWLIKPFVTSLPRESLEFTLETTRRTLAVP